MILTFLLSSFLTVYLYFSLVKKVFLKCLWYSLNQI